MSHNPEHQPEHHLYYDDQEISLKELILAIFKHRKLVVLIALAITALSVAYALFLHTPTYETQSAIMLNQTETYETPYGTYTYPAMSPEAVSYYIRDEAFLQSVIDRNGLAFSPEGLAGRIETSMNKSGDALEITTTSKDSQLAYNMNISILDSLDKQLRVEIKMNALNTFRRQLTNDISILEKKIASKEKIIEGLHTIKDSVNKSYVLKKLVTDDLALAAKLEDVLGTSIDEGALAEENANENYYLLETKIIEEQVNNLSMKEDLELKQTLLAGISDEMQRIETLEAGAADRGEILNGMLDVFQDKLMVIKKPVIPESPSGTGRLLIVAIGLVLGVMTGLFVGLFKHYWHNS